MSVYPVPERTSRRRRAPRRERFRLAHARLALALEQGFHLEAAVICESLLAEKLHLHLYWRVVEARTLEPFTLPEPLRARLTFTKPVALPVLAEIVKLDFDAGTHPSLHGLPQRVMAWARLRKSVARRSIFIDDVLRDHDEACRRAETQQAACSAAGILLVRELTNWDRARRAAHRRQQST